MKNKIKKVKDFFNKASDAGKTVIKRTKQGVKIAAAATVIGTGGYVYNQFNKTPEQARKDTKEMAQKVEKEVREISENNIGTNNAIQRATNKAASKIAQTGARHGGALREWIIRKRKANSK